MSDFDTSLPEAPMGCGCAQCLSGTGAPSGASSISSDYMESSTTTTSEANSLKTAYKWGTTSLDFIFLTSVPGYYSSTDTERTNFQEFTTQMKNAARDVLTQLEGFTNLTFNEVTNVANSDITFGQARLPTSAGAWAYYPQTAYGKGGDVWTNNYYSATKTPVQGNYGFYTLLHEVGHALGLEHSFTAGLTGDENTTMYTVMAYDWSPYYASTYMIYDIYALQSLYGANMSHEAGDTVYVLNATKGYTIWDAGGNDTFDASAQSSDVTINLNDGELSSVGLSRNIGIAINAIIENATGGAGNDTLIGNDVANVLTGNTGNDIFIGSDGNDQIDGGAGTDLMVYDLDIANFAFNVIDADTIEILDLSGTYAQDTVTGVENFEFNDTLFSFDDLVTASESGVSFASHVGVRFLNSMGRWVSIDSIQEGVETYTLSDLRMRGDDDLLTITRNPGSVEDDIDISVNSLFSSSLRSIKFQDLGTLDIISVSDIRQGIIIDEKATQDLSVALDNVFFTVIKTGSGSDTIDITNILTEADKSVHKIFTNDGDDTLTLSMDSDFAALVTKLGNGNDVLDASNFGGQFIKAFGDDGDDHLIGGDSADKLFGGNGNDTLEGGLGNDFLFDRDGLNNLLQGGDGDDRVFGNGTLEGGNGNDLLKSYGADTTLNGGNGDDKIFGHNGNDILNGGLGSDFLYGGRGNDIFVFDDLDNADFVKDFNAGQDSIDISTFLYAFDPLTDAITDFVHITTVGRSTFLQVDVNGSGGQLEPFLDIAQINGLRNVDIQELYDNGQLITTGVGLAP
ncbi:MAG: M10 family metallopeptidase C-terminal domain-containing protein [Alphaproteobacteria bacterium]|nr:M10 family metallopeptidase C-terminal domain-containing protein [Alphaproteobacteria bacterium]